MYVLASVLDVESQNKIRETWKWLEENCSLSGIKLTPLPHISWQVTDSYDLKKLEKCIDKFSSRTKPFCVNTAGLGVFTGTNPVLYTTVVKTECLMKFHKKIWDITKHLSDSQGEFYSQEFWVPHITLASRDVTPEKLANAIKGLANQSFVMNVWIRNLTCLYVINGETGIHFQYQFNLQVAS